MSLPKSYGASKDIDYNLLRPVACGGRALLKSQLMKIKNGLPVGILLRYGFVEVDKQKEISRDQYEIAAYNYKLDLGHSRRGQYYVLLVKENERQVMVYATEPDGSGGPIPLPDELIQMIADGVLVPD